MLQVVEIEIDRPASGNAAKTVKRYPVFRNFGHVTCLALLAGSYSDISCFEHNQQTC